MADRDAPDAGPQIDGAHVPAALGEMSFGIKRGGVGRELGPSAPEHYQHKSEFISDELRVTSATATPAACHLPLAKGEL